MSAQSLEAMTGMKSGKKKTHRGRRGGKTHSKPSPAKPKAPPPGALAALLAGPGGGAPPDPGMGGDPSAMALGAGAPAQAASDPAVSHLIAALSALHGSQGAGAPPQIG